LRQSEFIQGKLPTTKLLRWTGAQPLFADFSGYWVWQKIVENLAMLGYDTNSMDMAAYDW
jgi:phospholipid:diacylglycerol acyltransferase